MRSCAKPGAWPKIEAAGFIPKYGALFCLADDPGEKEVIFSQSLMPDLDYTYQVGTRQV